MQPGTNNLFMRPEDTEMIANICSFERMEVAINEFQSFKARVQSSIAIYQKLAKIILRLLQYSSTF